MGKHEINVGLNFSANTTQAERDIQNLQTSLTNIANTKISVQGGNIDAAVQSAKMLNEHLQKATNATTGKLDFSKLQTSLKGANTDLVTLSNSLLAVGPQGQKAFSQVANAVAHSELSIRKTNKALHNFGITLMNTIKWQAASTMIHAAMGAFQSAVSHIEDLDKSLNSIQIVSGKSAKEMASFAKVSQEAAKALSTTTKEYADASLIYFQQGLPEKEILARTEATIKMAKVTGDSVSQVSDQLTAIWNNFDDGTQSLERYVDVITALGAATASSTSEISDGLQKFAAIAETVGLSYEYAATALATVTAETRQSADVVGTAFKTLFARIQGLNLGETLDDGTTLNKYSAALAQVGIDIKLSNGELKDMNDILDEMGDKWNTLNEDQQVALAQTVGGIRQYNQLIALMDNWDTFKVNLEIAENSEGELDKQFEIYQSSIEASTAKLKNATQSLYENLLNPEMITGFNEALADTIGLINTIIENAGGIGKLFEFGGLLLLQMVLPKLQGFLMSAATHMKDFVGYTKAAKMYELDTMAKTSHAIAGTSQRTAEHQATTRVGKAAQWVENKASGALDKAFTATAGSTNPITQQINGALYTTTTVRDSVKQQSALSEAAFNPNAAAPINVAGVDMDASAMTMRNQMIQEEAGYTATILDTKKQILALENGLTDKQREGYKAYSDQVAKEQEALRLAREKQAVTKDAAEQSSRSGTMKVGSSKAGRDAKAAIKQEEIDRLEEERAKKVSSLTGDKDKIARETSKIDKEYNKRKEEVQNRHISNKQVDLKGDETKSMVEGFKDSDMSDTGQAITQSMTKNLTQSADGSGPAASVENLEKLGQLQAQYNADAAKASGIYAELSGNIGEAGKRTEQQQKTLKKTGDTMKTLGKDAKSGLVDSLTESAQQMEKTGDSAEGLKKVIKSLKDGSDIDLGNLSPKEIEAVKKSVGDLDEGLADASTSAGELADAMAQDMANATDQDVKIFTGIAEDAQVAKTSALEADGAAKQLQTTLNTQPPIIPDPFGAVTQGATQAVAAFTSFAMGAQMLSTGITTAFDENASAIERVMGAMMILQGVMSTVNAVQAAANAVDTFAVAIKAAKAIAAGKEAAAESKGIIAIVANTVATAANAVAKLFAAEASKGLAGVIAGVLGAALIAGTIAIVANTVATQQEAEAKQEAAAAAESEAAGHRENAEALREETAELNKNADAYRDLYKVYEETGEIKSDLTEKSYELATSLDVENASLLVLQGNYEGLNREIEKNLRLRNEEAMLKAQEAADSTGYAFATKAGQGNGYWTDDGDSDGQYTTGLWADTEASWIEDFLATDAGKKYADAGLKFTDGKLIADYDINDPSQLVEIWSMIDEMLNSKEFREFAPDDYDLTNSTLMTSYHTMKDETGDAYTNMLGVPTQILEQAKISGITASGMHTAENIDEFSEAYEDYLNYVAEQTGKDKDMIQDEVDEYLRNHDAYGDLYQQYDAFRSLPEDVQKYVEDNNLLNDSEAMSVILTARFNDKMTEDEIERMIGLSQKIVDNNKLLAKVELIPKLSSQLKDDMTKDEWDAWFESYEKQFGDFEQSTGMSKEKFMGMGAEAATKFLDTFVPSPEEQQAALDSNIATWTEQKQMLIDQGPVKAQTTTTLQGAELELAKMWTDFAQENEANNGTPAFSEEQIQAMINYASGSGLNIEDAAGLLEYLAKMTTENQRYNFGGPQMDVPTFLASEAAKAEKDEQARAEAVQAETERKEQIESYDTQINQAQEEKDYLKATDFKRRAINLDLDVTEVEEFAEALEDIPLIETEEEAKDLAIQITQMKRGLTTLAENWDDWSKAMKDGDLDSKVKAVSGMKKALGDLTGIDMSALPMSFFETETNAKLLEEAVKGDESAINDLMAAATKEIVLQMNLDADTTSKLQTLIDGTIDAIEVKDLEVGASLEASGMYKGFQDLLNSGAVTVDQMNDILKGVGFNPEIEMKKIPIDNAVASKDGNTYTVEYLDTEGNVQTKTITSQQYNDAASVGYIEIPVINGDTSSYTGGGGSINKDIQNDNKGGGGGKPQKLKPSKKSDVVDRYKEVNDQLDDVKDRMEDASRAAEGLWGPERLTQMKKVISAMKDEVKLLKQKKIEAQSHLQNDRQDLINTIRDNVGITIGSDSFDANNNFIDYNEVMNQLWEDLKEAEGAVKDKNNVTEDEQKAIDEVNERIEAVKSAIELYDTTKEELEDMDNEIADALLSIQQHNFELLTLELEMKITVNDADLKVLDYYLSKVSDDIYGMAESFTLMYGAMDDSGKWNTANSQLDTYVKELGDYNSQLQLLKEQYTTIDPETGERMIDKASFIEGLQQIQDGIYENLGNIEELKKSWKTFYGDTLAAASEELSKFTDLMEHHTSVLEHYNNLLSLLGRSKNFEQIGVVLKAQVETAENMANVSRKAYEDAQTRATAAKTAYDNSLTDDSLSEDDKEKIKNDWLAAQQAANEAQDKMLADAAAWAEALKAEVENKLEGLADVLKKAFSIEGYESIDEILTGMERKNTLQEEYLTQTNKIYETNKLIRQAQQEIDKTTNTAAKRRLAQFIEETSEMQDQNKLSQYELEIMQAKYDLRLAEIALEEAQNAKSTVRLQRDAEGNFGYVYTADQNQISDAEQQLADAENALYNIGLEGANKYSQKYAEAVSAMNDEITALTQAWASGEISSWEEYERQKKAITEHYGALLKDYSSLHAISLTTDSNVAKEAWSKDFNSMMGSTEEWMTAVEDYVGEVRGVFSDWETDMGRIAEYTVGKNLDDLAGKTNTIKTANEQLAESITKEGGVLDSIDQMIEKIKTMLQGMGIFWDTIDTIITDAEGTGEDIATIIENESDDDPNNDLQPVVSDDSTPPIEEPPKQDPPAPPPDDPESYKKGVVTFSGNGGDRVWTDEAGKTYAWNSKEGDELQTAFNRAAGRNGGYKGDYWLGWTKTGGKLNADVLHEKYGLATGGYTGEWEGSYGKLAFLHQKELVLNAKDTENFLASMEVLDRILKILDLQALNSQLSGNISSPGLNMPQQEVLEQQIHIEAHFPDATDRNEIEEAFKSLADLATQYAHRR